MLEGPGPQTALLRELKNSETRLSWDYTVQAPAPSLSFLESWASVRVGTESCGLISVVTGDQRAASYPVRVLVDWALLPRAVSQRAVCQGLAMWLRHTVPTAP